MDDRDKIRAQAARNVEIMLLEGLRKRLAAEKLAAKEEMFRNALGVRLKKPKP